MPSALMEKWIGTLPMSDQELLSEVHAVVEQGPYAADWDSLRTYSPPRWYHDAKFGIFLHWGVYSVPAFDNEWYSRTMYLQGSAAFEHHRATYGDQKDFGYKDFIPQFTMKDFEPQQWAATFRRAGAQFVVPVAEHHDGFAMYNTERSPWNAAQMGPKRDVLGDLLEACEASGIARGASTHRAEHWFFMNGGMRFDSDVRDPAYADFYGPAQREETAPHDSYLHDWLLRTVELIDSYRPQVLWFDWWIEQPAFEPYLRLLAAYYYNRAAQWGQEVVINYKWEAFARGSAVYDIERGAVGRIQDEVWQNDTSVSRSSWCYTEGHRYKSVAEILAELADVVAKNGVLLLNVGPKADGTLPQPEIEMLEQIGDWLTRNGEAIYGSRPWLIAEEGPARVAVGSFVDGEATEFGPRDFRFTTRTDVTGEYIYAIGLSTPVDGTVRVKSFGADTGLITHEIASVSVLGHAGAVNWRRDGDGLEVDLPQELAGEYGPVVKVFLKPDPVRARHDFLHG